MKAYLGITPHSEFAEYKLITNLGFLRESFWTEYYDYFAIEYDDGLFFGIEVQIITGSIPKEHIIKIL